MQLITAIVSLTLINILLSGCAQRSSYPQQDTMGGPAQPAQNPAISTIDLKSLPDTVGIEHQDRVNRFNRLSTTARIHRPQIDEMQLAKGQVPGFTFPVPVVRVTFDERIFFDFNKDILRPEASIILNVIAENMKNDVPDAQLTILGHTDAIGTDDYNIDLSRRRALSVMRSLVNNGVKLGQLSTVAVGESQPVAPNSTDDGRARNRRVEFMVSASENANLTLVSKRRIIEEYLRTKPDELPKPRQKPIRVFKPTQPNAKDQQIKLSSTGTTIQLKKPMPQAKLANLPNYKVATPKEYHQAELNNEFEL